MHCEAEFLPISSVLCPGQSAWLFRVLATGSGQGGNSWTLLTKLCAPLQGYMPPEKGISFSNLYKSALWHRGSPLCELWMWSSPHSLSFLAAHVRPEGTMVPISPGGSEIAAIAFSG